MLVLLGDAMAGEDEPPAGEEPAAGAVPPDELQAARAAASVRPAAAHIPLASRERCRARADGAGRGVNDMKGV